MSVVNKILKNYTKIPLWATNLAAPLYLRIPEKYRYGSIFRKEMQEVRRIETLSPAEVEKEKNAAIQRLMVYVYAHVPYYHALFDREGIDPQTIRCEADMQVIPFLTKDILREQAEQLLSDDFDRRKLVYIRTSGTSGTPTGFYVQKESPMREWVYGIHMLHAFGYGASSSKLVLRGKRFWAQEHQHKNWQWDALRQELSVNLFDMSPDNMEQYCRAIERYRPDFAYGYMSAMYALCQYIQSRPGGLRHQFRGFLGVSETITEEQRQFVERVIGARVFSFYGMSERVIIAAECPYSTEYHVEPLYGVAELVDTHGTVLTEPQKEGELVGTSLLNYAMPLIRYKTGDVACWSARPVCRCQSGMKRLQYVAGRKHLDCLINKDNRAILHINAHSGLYDKMFRFQFVQTEVGKAILRIVPAPGVDFTPELVARVEKEFTESTLNKVEFRVQLVDTIPPKKNGKVALVEQHLDVEKYL